jgi:hypothetical protein
VKYHAEAVEEKFPSHSQLFECCSTAQESYEDRYCACWVLHIGIMVISDDHSQTIELREMARQRRVRQHRRDRLRSETENAELRPIHTLTPHTELLHGVYIFRAAAPPPFFKGGKAISMLPMEVQRATFPVSEAKAWKRLLVAAFINIHDSKP